jgi:hypothetical protein
MVEFIIVCLTGKGPLWRRRGQIRKAAEQTDCCQKVSRPNATLLRTEITAWDIINGVIAVTDSVHRSTVWSS